MSSTVLQASCLAIGDRAVLIEGPSGSGKSALTLALMDRGAVLIGDDGVTLDQRGEQLFASPPPNTAGLVEVRNVGLLHFTTTSNVRVALVIVLDPDAPRFADAAEPADRCGISLPLIRLWPSENPPARKVELSMDRYGLV